MAVGVRRIRVLISGRVQGVWYRESTRREAERLGVRGWVRNLDDGRVEALLEGDDDDVLALIRWCGNGPPAAHVVGVETFDETGVGEPLTGFSVRR